MVRITNKLYQKVEPTLKMPPSPFLTTVIHKKTGRSLFSLVIKYIRYDPMDFKIQDFTYVCVFVCVYVCPYVYLKPMQ